jgi:cytochrome oxidase assembly protein ShyY1
VHEANCRLILFFDCSRVVFINRGWLPRQTQNYSRPTGPQKVDVFISESEQQRTFSPKNDPASKTLLWLESSALLKAAGHVEVQSPLIFDAFGKNYHGTYTQL